MSREDPTNGVLAIALQAAVQLHILELAALPPERRARVIETWAAQAVDPIASQGDVLMFGSRRKGETAKVFAHLAKGLAALAYSPGGVTFQGTHWEAPPDVRAERVAPSAFRRSVVDVELPSD